MKPVLILGIGNILLRDEGIGVRTIEAMRSMDLPPNVEVLDGGTSGVDLVDDIADRPKVVVIDAIQSDAPAGTVYRLSVDDLLHEAHGTMSLHEFGLLDTLMTARHLGCSPQEVVIFAVVPADVRPGLELSDELTRRMPQLIQSVLAEACGVCPVPSKTA